MTRTTNGRPAASSSRAGVRFNNGFDPAGCVGHTFQSTVSSSTSSSPRMRWTITHGPGPGSGPGPAIPPRAASPSGPTGVHPRLPEDGAIAISRRPHLIILAQPVTSAKRPSREPP